MSAPPLGLEAGAESPQEDAEGLRREPSSDPAMALTAVFPLSSRVLRAFPGKLAGFFGVPRPTDADAKLAGRASDFKMAPAAGRPPPGRLLWEL